MFILDSYLASVFFCVITMLCWGSWANTQKLASKEWRFELFYWDYVLGVLLLSVASAFTLGSHGDVGRGFIADVDQALSSSVLSAIFGGVVFNLANILLVAAIALAGMAVAFPVGIGIALVLGVIVNYMAAPSGNALFLFAGVALVTVAILLDARAYQKLSQHHSSTPPVKGIVLSIVSGILMGLFYRFVAAGMTLDFANPEPGKLGPYSAVVFFSIGVFLSSFIFVPLMMKNPVSGPPVTMADYFKGNARSHLTGILGGVIWCIGMSLNLIASGRAGFAISYGLGQGATMIAAIWGIFFWKEFKSAPAGTNRLLTAMMASYLFGLVCIILAHWYE